MILAQVAFSCQESLPHLLHREVTSINPLKLGMVKGLDWPRLKKYHEIQKV